MENTELWGDVVKWGASFKVKTAGECCDACLQEMQPKGDKKGCNGEPPAAAGGGGGSSGAKEEGKWGPAAPEGSLHCCGRACCCAALLALNQP